MLTYRIRSNKPEQKITCRISTTGRNNLKRTKNDEPMPIAIAKLGHEVLVLHLEGKLCDKLEMNQIVRLQLTNIKKVMRCHWKANIAAILKVIKEDSYCGESNKNK